MLGLHCKIPSYKSNDARVAAPADAWKRAQLSDLNCSKIRQLAVEHEGLSHTNLTALLQLQLQLHKPELAVLV